MHHWSEWKSQHDYSVTSVQWYPYDTGMFISGGMDCAVNVWDANTLQVVSSFKFDSHVNTCQMSAIATAHTLIASK